MGRRILSRAEVEHATYIDFEGRIDAPPVLLGIATFQDPDASLLQLVLDDRYRPAADAKDLRTIDLTEAVRTVVVLAEERDGPIVGWSRHEEAVVRRLCPAPLAERFTARYVNAIPTAARWRRALGIARHPDGERLARYLHLAGLRVAPVHGPGRTGSTLAVLGSALERGRGYASLTPRRKARWTALLAHNRIDVLGMREVCDRATTAA